MLLNARPPLPSAAWRYVEPLSVLDNRERQRRWAERLRRRHQPAGDSSV